METVSYTLRLPIDVRDYLESRSAATGKSCAQLVIEALALPEKQRIYLMKRGERHKIGISCSPERRRAALGADVELVWDSDVEDARGVESALHAHFKSQRVEGEWFNLSADDVIWVQSLDLYNPVVGEFVSRTVACKCHPPKFITTARWRGFEWVKYGQPIPLQSPKPNMAALREICAGNVPQSKITPEMVEAVHGTLAERLLCPHKEWADDGEQYRCRLVAGHKGKCLLGERVS